MSNVLDFYEGKRVFITGHTGFKGSWLTKILVMAGATVYGYSLEPSSQGDDRVNLYHILELEKDIHAYFGDIRDYDKLSHFLISQGRI